jgi:hypothetical protein
MLGFLSVAALAFALGWSSPGSAQGAPPNQPDQPQPSMMCPCCRNMASMMRGMMGGGMMQQRQQSPQQGAPETPRQ